jgi:hypothetical protein
LEGWYTFNLNPVQQNEFESTANARWNKTYKEIQAIISDVIDEAEIEGTLEISRNGRIHMHGYIKFKSIAIFYLKLPRLLKRCTIEIDTITDLEKWEEYCTKGKDYLKNFKTHIKQDKLSIDKNAFKEFAF